MDHYQTEYLAEMCSFREGAAARAQCQMGSRPFNRPRKRAFPFSAPRYTLMPLCVPEPTMPTEKPRFTITTSKPIFETVSRLADLQGVSKSHVINDLLEAIHPPLMRTVALLEAAQEAPLQVREGLKSTVLDMEREMAGTVGSAIGQMDWLQNQLRAPQGGRDTTGPAAVRPARGGRTPHSNTGVRNSKPLKNKQSKKRA